MTYDETITKILQLIEMHSNHIAILQQDVLRINTTIQSILDLLAKKQ
jgi:hypothetical protein